MTKIIERIAPPNIPTIEVFGKKIIKKQRKPIVPPVHVEYEEDVAK
jgi:hypothetical protein